MALYDANVLYPNTLRDLLIRIGQSGLVEAKWTDMILDEMLRSLAKNRPDIDEAKLDVLRARVNEAVLDASVTGFEELIPGLDLPDPDDRHVLAAAIKCGAQVIVTNNVRHFPQSVLSRWGIEAKRPDEFVLDQIDLDVKVVYACVQQIVDSRKRSPETIDDVLRQLERSGLVEAAATLRIG
ncbi:MAG TPA: PIN domain-containing protein [Actinocrinis sp.]|nr:PIN domain-containing protein [Actinocrinis sp.]HEV2346742.1 PIN domain-containing protein [Actinocrinis sp.]